MVVKWTGAEGTEKWCTGAKDPPRSEQDPRGLQEIAVCKARKSGISELVGEEPDVDDGAAGGRGPLDEYIVVTKP